LGYDAARKVESVDDLFGNLAGWSAQRFSQSQGNGRGNVPMT
jgi:hypothetical protein